MSGVLKTRIRLRYCKDQVLKYVGHRDLLRLIMRLLRQADIPYATSGRFSPKPSIAFSPPLPLGVSADNELLDIELDSNQCWDTHDTAAAAVRLAQAAAQRKLVRNLVLLSDDIPGISHLVCGSRYIIICTDAAP